MHIIYKTKNEQIIHKCTSDHVPIVKEKISIKEVIYTVVDVVHNIDKEKYIVYVTSPELLTEVFC